MARQRLRVVGQFIRRHHLPDHAPRQRLLGADFVTQHGHAHRAGVAGQPRQEPAAAGVRYQPQTAERLNEAGIVGGDDDIARQGQRGAGAGRHAVDRAHHRLRQGGQATDQGL